MRLLLLLILLASPCHAFSPGFLGAITGDSCTTAPTAAEISATKTGNQEITISQVTPATGATSYQLYHVEGASVVTTGALPYAHGGLDPDTTYSYIYKAINACGSTDSNTVSETTDP